MKKTIFFIGLALLITLSLFFLKNKLNQYPNILHIELKGAKIMNIVSSSQYHEPGYSAFDKKENITDQVIVTMPELKENGTYEIIYKVTNKKGETATEKRYVILNSDYKDEYDTINNEARAWWSNNKKDGTRPTGGYTETLLNKYNATFIGEDKKTIYLTFDEGSTDTYLDEIVEVLDQLDVKATFFLCKKYIETYPDLIKKMAEKGHSIGNHTAHHVEMNKLATKENYQKYLTEILEIEQTYYNITGKEMDKVYREPKGEWSERSLKIVSDLGYKTFFYSADYLDWNGEVTKEYALNELKKRVHNGAIYLIHPINKGNYLAMSSFIQDMKKEGYTFDLVKNINIKK